MTRTRTLSLALALSALCAARPARALGDVKIGYVDLQRAMAETDEGKKAKAKLQSDFDKKQKDLDARQEDMKKKKADCDKRSAVLKPEAAAQCQQELQKELITLQEIYMRLQKDLQEKEATEMGRILKKMQGIIQVIAEKEGFTYVFERNTGILYAPPSLEITNEVIRKYNAAAGGAGAK